MSDDKPNVSTTDPGPLTEWQREAMSYMWPKTAPHTLDDCMAAIEDQWASTHGGNRPEWGELFAGPPTGLSAAQEIRLRLVEAFDDPDPDLPMLTRLAAWVERGDDAPHKCQWMDHYQDAAKRAQDAEEQVKFRDYQAKLVLGVLVRAGDEAPGIDREIRAIYGEPDSAPEPARFDPYANGDGAEATG